jgi:hypothetical protein
MVLALDSSGSYTRETGEQQARMGRGVATGK